MATMTALAVARHVKSGVDVRANGLRDSPRPFAFYLSPEAHSCARKAIELLGFGSAAIRTIPTGAIDDLDAIAGVCRRHDVWMRFLRSRGISRTACAAPLTSV